MNGKASFFFPLGYYFTGDGAYRDADGHYQITGRVDDVINIKGHRLGTAELESAMVRGPEQMGLINYMYIHVCLCAHRTGTPV